MNIQNIKFAKRNLLKNKTVSAINIIGLSVGIAVSMLIFTYAYNEFTTDRSLPDVENIYSVTKNGEPYMSYNFIELIRNEIPEAKNITLCSTDWSSQVYLKNGDSNFKIENALCADSCFFQVFPFNAFMGNPANALNKPNSVVLTKKLAKKIFGDENPIGKSLTYNATNFQDIEIQVGAVIDDLPKNSSWNFEAVISLPTYFNLSWYERNMRNWGTNSYNAFLRTEKNITTELLNEKLAALPKDKIPNSWKERKISSVPFLDVYFDYPQVWFLKHGNRLILSIILTTGILIMLLACINYANLVTAQREKRCKNIGIIKTLGSQRISIVKLFAIESVLSFILSTSVAIGLVIVVLPFIKSFYSTVIDLETIFSFQNLVLLSIVFAFTLLITGIAPGIIFSRYKAHLLLKKQIGTKNRGNLARNSMLVFQFVVSIVLISGILFINKQYRYMEGFNTGHESENIVFVNNNIDLGSNFQTFKNEVDQISGIKGMTYCSSQLGYMGGEWGRMLVKDGQKEQINFAKFTVSPTFFDFFGLDITKGSGFGNNSEQLQQYIFNQKTETEYGIETQGKDRINYGDKNMGHIIGIVEDFNIQSLHVPIRPAGFTCSTNPQDVIYLKTNVGNMEQLQQTMGEVENIWNKLSPNFPFEYGYLDSSLEALYAKEKLFQSILRLATFVSLLLSCLGLVGLTFFIMEQRTKEIGIRKVNGARVTEILSMLNKDFVRWVFVAFVIACPIAWYAMSKWFENFAYKTTLSWWVFALAGLLALGIALLTVSFQSYKAATRNPIEALRYE